MRIELHKRWQCLQFVTTQQLVPFPDRLLIRQHLACAALSFPFYFIENVAPCCCFHVIPTSQSMLPVALCSQLSTPSFISFPCSLQLNSLCCSPICLFTIKGREIMLQFAWYHNYHNSFITKIEQ